MRHQWLRRKGSADLILVFSGWAVGSSPFLHLVARSDVLVLDDYRDEAFSLEDLARYDRLYVAAYSMGVSVAARLLPRLRPKIAVAICGTVTPVSASRGISPEIYAATATNLTAASLARFVRRAGAPLPEAPDLPALQEELLALADRPAASASGFDRIFAGQGDRIFKRTAMQAAWSLQPINWLETGHNPFPKWTAWEEILA